MRKSRLIVNSLLLALLICLTSVNFTLLLYAGPVQCEEEGAPECEEPAQIYCDNYCDEEHSEDCIYDSICFDSGECGCSGTCYQWWYFECTNNYFDFYECVTYGHGCPMK